MSDPELIARIADLLSSQSTLALATSAVDGSAHVAPLFYVSGEQFRLYWFSSASSNHSRNLEARPQAAVTVYRHTERWEEIRGVQMRGAVSVIPVGEQRRAIEQAYAERFHLGSLFQAEIVRSSLYVFQPSWIRYLDNSLGAGYKIERPIASLAP